MQRDGRKARSPPIAHRDIKAENVLLHNSPYEFCVKLCDFGLAKQESMGTDKTVAPTMVSMTGAGTLSFMAPELFNPELAKDGHSSAASDVYDASNPASTTEPSDESTTVSLPLLAVTLSPVLLPVSSASTVPEVLKPS